MLWLSLPIAKADVISNLPCCPCIERPENDPREGDGYKKGVWASLYSVVRYTITIQPLIEAVNMNFSSHLPTLLSLVCGLVATANALPLDKDAVSEHSTRGTSSGRNGWTKPIPTWTIVGIVVSVGFVLSVIMLWCCKRQRAAAPLAYLPPTTTQPSAPPTATVQPTNSFPVIQEPPPAYTPRDTSGGVCR